MLPGIYCCAGGMPSRRVAPSLTYKCHGAEMVVPEGRPLRRLILCFLRPCLYVELLCQVLALLLCHLPNAAQAHVSGQREALNVTSGMLHGATTLRPAQVTLTVYVRLAPRQICIVKRLREGCQRWPCHCGGVGPSRCNSPGRGQGAAPQCWHSNRPGHRYLPGAGILRCWTPHATLHGPASPAKEASPNQSGVHTGWEVICTKAADIIEGTQKSG